MRFSGDPVFWVLAFLGAVTLLAFLARFLAFRRAQIDGPDFVKGVINVLDAGNEAEALAICDETPVPISAVVATALRNRRGLESVMREAVATRVRTETDRLRRRLVAFAVIAQISPILGLLGTIIGFIRTVMLMNGDEPVLRSALTGECLPALVTAAAGLAVAIAASVMHATLRVRLAAISMGMEVAASEIVGYLVNQSARETGR